MDVRKLILQVIDSLTLLSDVLLIVVCLVGNRNKEVLYVLQGDSTSLHVLNGLPRVNPVGINLPSVHLSTPRFVGSQILLIAYEYYGHHEVLALILVGVNALQEVISPLFYSLVAFAICYVEYNYAAVSSSVKSVAQRLETLLASCIPDLKGHHLTCFCFYFLFYEVCAYCWFLANAGFFILVAFNKAGLSDTGVSDYDDLQKLLVFAIRSARA